ncbi:NmrA/HSCARG family protein [Catenulispora rubra]|uniref:NmrA/HSCARG family protein n=1 Tax=Catenulispora rubra TaxID=280293 RepID=UPI00189274C4|nr:NmrA/HSCARG family protein [Catenulispora rubra]
MSAQKIIAVVGATGTQGGSVVRAILADPNGEFLARAITRDADSAKAKELAALGAEVVTADLDDQDSLRRAFDGAYGAFIVTNYWAPRTPDQVAQRTAAQMELDQAGNAARAAGEARLRHVVWSTLEDTRPFFGLSGALVPTVDDGRYTVPHFDAKAEADEMFRELGVPTTFLHTTFFFDGLLSTLAPRRDEQGRLVLALPAADTKLSGIASEDVGRAALGVFRRSDLVGRTISIAGEHLTGAQYATVFSEVIGEPVTYQAIPFEAMRAGTVEGANMFQFYSANEKQFTGDRDLAAVRELNPELQSFHTFLANHLEALQLG